MASQSVKKEKLMKLIGSNYPSGKVGTFEGCVLEAKVNGMNVRQILGCGKTNLDGWPIIVNPLGHDEHDSQN